MSNTAPRIPDSLTNVKKFVFSDLTNNEKIGHGNEAKVYKRCLEKYGDVAIKAFFIELKVDEMREVEVLIKHSRHPNIVQLYGVLVTDMASTLCAGYVMEYMPNGSLDDVIHKLGTPYSWTEISSWIQQIFRGLAYLHGEGIIHRDIKPCNLLLGNRLELLKISDFGLAKQVDVGSHTSVVGTYCYMAPEVILTRKYSFSADIYSFAITVWELFCRKRPYYHLDQSSQFALLTKIVGGERPSFESFVDEVAVTFLIRAWAANPGERPEIRDFLTFANIANLQVELNTTVQQTGVHEVPMLIGGQFLDILDVEANTWKRLSLPLPYSARNHGSAFLNGAIYIFGGSAFEESGSAYKLTKEMKWTKLPDMKEGRLGICNSTVVFEGCIWVIGGYNYHTLYHKTVEAYDPKSNSWIRKPDMNTERRMAAAAVVKEKIFVCGGRNGNGPLNSVEYFDPQLSKWIFCTPIPAPRHRLAAVAQDCFLTVMGGCDHREEDTADVWRMNVDDSPPTWSVLASMKKPRRQFAAWILDGRIMVAGGKQTGYIHRSSVESFDGNEWTMGPSLQSHMYSMAVTLVPQNLAETLLATYPPA